MYDKAIDLLKNLPDDMDYPTGTEFRFALNTWYRENVIPVLNEYEDKQKVYLHKKRGTRYIFIATGKFQSNELYTKTRDDIWLTDTFKSVDMIEVAIYRSVDDGEFWARPLTEFNDGRFELVEEKC